MYRFSIVCVGSLKEEYWKKAVAEYAKRLSPTARVSVLEVAEVAFSKSADGDRVKQKEGEKLLAKIPAHSYVIALDPRGKKLTSEQFAADVGVIGMRGTHIIFIIGGPLGLSEEVKEKADQVITLSALTFTHQLARIVLFEQIYRAMAILHGKTYHY